MILIIRDLCFVLQSLTARQANIAAGIAGVIATLALPPFDLWVMTLPALCLLFLLTEQQDFKVGFIRGFWFGLGYLVSNLYWIAFALRVELEQFYWLIPFAVLGLPAILSLYIAMVCGLFSVMRLSRPVKWLYFAGLWGASEWLRGHLFTGFPWNLIGYSWMQSLGMLQSTAVIGIYGLSVLTVLLATAPILYLYNHKKWFWGFMSVLCLIWSAGSYRLTLHKTEFVENIHLRLVQPCISQKLKWDKAARAQNFVTHMELSQLPSQQPLTHIIWPEAAVPFFLENETVARQQIAALISPPGSIILGGLRYRSAADAHSLPQLWNSLFVLNANGDIVHAYDKAHLVPFGEYIPLRTLWPAMVKKITYGTIDFSAGPGLRTLNIDGLPPVSPLICYEGIFPHQVVKREDNEAKWMLNLTNDAWYGKTSGPYQHFAITRVRAIEQGIPLVRVANNGISAVIDPYGRIVKKLDLNHQGVLDSFLPKVLPEQTLYAQHGDTLFFIILSLIGLISFINWLYIRKR